jgi:AcrR family transcriptional regulator
MADARVVAPDQRGRILDAALRLMGEQGAAGTSMRQLAGECGLNVATLYHYFPSKADLLRSVIEDRRYLERLAVDEPAADEALAPRPRFVKLVRWLWDATLQEEFIWRLLVGEALRGEQDAVTSAITLLDALESTMAGWLADRFPEMQTDATAGARLVRGLLVAGVVERLVTGTTGIEQRAEDLATLLFPV